MSALKTFLVSAKLEQYEAALVELGAMDITDLKDVDGEELTKIGMKKIEQTRLKRAVESASAPAAAPAAAALAPAPNNPVAAPSAAPQMVQTVLMVSKPGDEVSPDGAARLANLCRITWVFRAVVAVLLVVAASGLEWGEYVILNIVSIKYYSFNLKLCSESGYYGMICRTVDMNNYGDNNAEGVSSLVCGLIAYGIVIDFAIFLLFNPGLSLLTSAESRQAWKRSLTENERKCKACCCCGGSCFKGDLKTALGALLTGLIINIIVIQARLKQHEESYGWTGAAMTGKPGMAWILSLICAILCGIVLGAVDKKIPEIQ